MFTRLAGTTGGRINHRGRFAPGYPIVIWLDTMHDLRWAKADKIWIIEVYSSHQLGFYYIILENQAMNILCYAFLILTD